MTNFRRALLALITFITGVGLSLGIGGGLASAHANAVTGVASCVDLKTNTWAVTYTIANDYPSIEDVTLVSSTGGGTLSGLPAVIAASPGQPYKTATVTQSGIPASAGSASLTIKGTWRSDGYSQNNGSGNIGRPGNCALTPVTPAVTYTPPTCTAVGTLVGIPGTGYTWGPVTGTPAASSITATATPGYTLTKSVFGPYVLAQVTGDPCKIISTPVAPTVTRSAVCATLDTYTAGPTTGVLYNGQASVSGSLNQGQVVVITATPAAGYKFAGNSQSIPFPIEGGAVEVCETTTTTTTVPATTTTVPTPCVYDVNLPADSPLCKAPPTTTVPPAVCAYNPALPAGDAACVPATPPQLPATGKGDGGLILGALLLAGGIVALLVARRPRRHA